MVLFNLDLFAPVCYHVATELPPIPAGRRGFEKIDAIEQNKNFVQLRGAKKRIFAEMSVLAWLATKTSFVRIMGFYGSGSVKTLPVLLLYYRL